LETADLRLQVSDLKKEDPTKSNVTLRRGTTLALIVAGICSASLLVSAQDTKQPVQHFSGTAANVTGAPEPLKIDLLRWSTDAERDQLSSALDKSEKEFVAALGKEPTLGYIWTSESAGYTVRYAYRIQATDGSQRIIVAADKPLGSWNPQIWHPVGNAKGNTSDFTLLELRLPARRAVAGEGKSSLLAKVYVDKTAKSIALDGYATAPVVLKNVKWENGPSS
jgi:hypothetical protein